MNATSKVNVLSEQGFSGTVMLTSQFTGSNLTATFNPVSIIVPMGGSGSSMVVVKSTKNASMGTTSIILTGTAASGKRVLSSSTVLTATIDSQADFAAYAIPYSITVTAGFSNSSSIIVESKNGFVGSVSLFATVPFGFLGVMGGQSPMTVTSASTATTSLQVSTISTTAVGNYNVTVTGVSGTVSHSCILKVTVVDPAPESLSLTGVALASPIGLILSIRNNGNTPVTLQSYAVADISGDSYTLSSWLGPTISPGTTSQATIFIGTSCTSCVYNGVPFAFQQFMSGHSYTVTVTTKLGTQFTFTVVP